MTLRRNILIFHQAALGDFIMTWPLALGLGRVLAQSRLFYITAAQKGALAERALRVESVDMESGWHQLYSAEPNLPEPAQRLLRGTQWIINFVAGENDLWLKNVRAIAPEAKIVSLQLNPPDDSNLHVTEFMLQQLAAEPIAKAALEQMLKSVAARGLGVTGALDGPVAIHPGSGSDAKCWPLDRFVELAKSLQAQDRKVQFILGEVELERWPADDVRMLKATADVSTPNSLVALLEIISKSSSFVGNDSGPGHLSAILGIPTISIFGPRDSERWRPLGPKVQVVGGEWNSISVVNVMKLLP
jgi:heptosyltransferase-3